MRLFIYNPIRYVGNKSLTFAKKCLTSEKVLIN